MFVSEQQSPSPERLHTYLNDHFGGSVAAIELLDNLIDQHPEDRFGKVFRNLRNEIEADQKALRDLIRKLGAEESAMRKAGAWLVEKFSRIKMGDGDNSAELLEALEALALGITGKQLLWRSLAAIAADHPPLQGVDFSELEKRACDQFDRVDALRVQMAREAFRR
jgi:hypothetical protein